MSGMNEKSPMFRQLGELQMDLQKKLSHVCVVNSATSDIVMGAAINLLINALVQTYDRRAEAEMRFDIILGEAKNILMQNYDGMGKRLTITKPPTQGIVVPHFGDPAESAMGVKSHL